MSVVIIDYGMGNLASVANMVRKAGGKPTVTRDRETILAAEKLILPGVGAFDHGMTQLHELHLSDAITQKAAQGTPLLGICLGMQLLARRSEEGELAGLALIDAEFERFRFESGPQLRVPHVGWNVVHVERDSVLLPLGSSDEQRFYFTHTYRAVCKNPDDVLATTLYGVRFPSAYRHGRVYGVQFHPEKSHRFGLALIKRYLELACSNTA